MSARLLLTGRVVSKVSCTALNSWRTPLSYNPDIWPLSALNPLDTDLVVLEVASAVLAGVLELLLLATGCVRQGTVAKADYPPTLAESGSPGGKGAILPQMRAQRHMHPRSAPQESSLGEP